VASEVPGSRFAAIHDRLTLVATDAATSVAR
jgi:hypothetical protein